MADSKKYNGSTWEHSLRKLTTATDTITTLPVDLYADGNNATVGLKGNTTQSGTPTPDNPVMPEGTGDKTANLFDYKTAYSSYISDNDIVISPSDMISSKNYFTFEEIGETITISAYAKNITSNRVYIAANINGAVYTGQSINAGNQGTISLTVTPTSTNDYFVLSYGSGGTYNTFNNMMLVKGSTVPSEYIPFGYKIPISSAGQTTPIYLGEVETTRRIKKLVFDGTENWAINQSGTDNAYFSILTGLKVKSLTQQICTHFVWGDVSSSNTTKGIYMTQSGVVRVRENEPSASDLTSFKSYLQQQYAAGTPVTVWYILATPETGIVNEPLMKIGDFADEVSGITVPTIIGKDTFDVDTMLKPSEVSLSYTGWHDATVEEWDGSQWNE